MGFWSLSFYPQIWENYKRKKVHGLSYEFVVMQTLAYFLYSVYTLTGRIEMSNITSMNQIEKSKREYIDQSDVYFAIHAFLLSSLIYT